MATTTTTQPPSTSTSPPTSSLSPLQQHLQTHGYVHIPNLLSASQLTSLRQAATNSATLARSGKWPFYRTVPKQFPPWPEGQEPPSEGIWGVQHLLHPDMPGREEFARCYFSREVLGIVEELLGLKLQSNTLSSSSSYPSPKSSLVLELFNLLISPPPTQPFSLTWHRDDIRPTLSPTEELKELQYKSPSGLQSHTQYNIALYPDDSLVLIPGSHRRARTETERSADPYADELPGMLRLKLSAGDAVFYDSNVLHRGVYNDDKSSSLSSSTTLSPKATPQETRLTLHGSVSLINHGPQRATNVLQHGVGKWIGREDAGFGGGKLRDPEMEDWAEAMRARLMEMGSGRERDGDVGFSLEG